MFDKIKDLMEMKKQADRIKRELDAQLVECSDVKGIKITINGSQDVKSIDLDDSLLGAGNKSRLQAELLKGINAAIRKSQMAAAAKMKSMMPGGFPGL